MRTGSFTTGEEFKNAGLEIIDNQIGSMMRDSTD
jgi:hypothetical protein